MQKCNAVTHALLNNITNANLILLQKLWFDQISTARKDGACKGIDVLRRVASPAWNIIYPGLDKKKCPKVMAYMPKLTQSTQDTPHYTVVLHLDVCSHPAVQVLDFNFNNERWQVINFYHDIQDPSSLDTLFSLDINAITPTLVTGDFNAHS